MNPRIGYGSPTPSLDLLLRNIGMAEQIFSEVYTANYNNQAEPLASGGYIPY